MSPADLVYPVAIGLAEGGWITVLYLLVDALARVPTPLGVLAFGSAAGLACLLAGRLDRLAGSRLAVVVGLLGGGALLGLLASGGTATVARGAGLDGILTIDPGAALIGLAGLRGFVRAGAIRDPDVAVRPFLVGLLGLAAIWIFAGALGEPMRAAFRAAAALPTVAFAIGGLASAGLSRSNLAAEGVGFDPRTNRPWLLALAGLTAGLGMAALPVGDGLERIMAALIAWPLALPLAVVGAVVARLLVPSRARFIRRTGLYTAAPLIFFVVVAVLVVLLPHHEVAPTPIPDVGVGGGETDRSSPVFDALLVVLAIGAAVLVLLFLARAWRRTTAGAAGRPLADRRGREGGSIDGEPDDGAGLGLGRRVRRLLGRGRPSDAVTAYLAALRALDADADLRRDRGETPAAHAHRLHELGAGSLELDLLAADFELARWGGRRLSAAEDRRAIGRWDRLRRRLAAGPAER